LPATIPELKLNEDGNIVTDKNGNDFDGRRFRRRRYSYRRRYRHFSNGRGKTRRSSDRGVFTRMNDAKENIYIRYPRSPSIYG